MFLIELYDAINVLSFFAFLLFSFVQIKETGTRSIYSVFLPEKIQKSAIGDFISYFAIALILSLCAYPLVVETLGWNIGDLFYDFTGRTGAVVYFCWIVFAPIFLFAGTFLIGIKPFKTIDLLPPAYSLALTYSKIACFCSGCCNGIQTDYGFYNYDTQLREFPVQLVESAEALVIFLILMRIRKEVKLGTMFPLYLVFYSGMRFFSEFLRAQPDIFGPFKCAQIFCIAGIILGFLGFVLAEKYAERIDEFFGRIYSKIEQKLMYRFLKKSA